MPILDPRHPRAPLLCVLLGVALVLPSLAAGFIADDYMQIAQLERWSAVPSGPLDLYVFIPRDPAAVEELRQRGILPYFAAPGLRIAFLRPLSSGLMWLDHTLFGRWPLPYHLHTLLWYAGLLLAASALFRRSLPPALALLSLLLFCLDDAHSMAAGWIAARNATVACLLVFAGLIAHQRWRTEGWRPGALLAPAAVALGMAGGEMALGALAYFFAWELSGKRPHRLRALAPTLALAAAYLLVHRLTGSGGRAGGGYLDPFGAPLDFLRAVPERALLLVGNLILGAPIDLLLFQPAMRVPLVAAGAAAVGLLGLWLPRALARMSAGEAQVVRFFGLGAAGAMLVSVPALIGERVLLAASLGGSVVVAALLRDAWRCFADRRGRALATAGLLALALPNLALAAISLPAKTLFLRKMSTDYQRLAGQAEISAPVPARVVVVALPDLLALQLPVLRAFDQQLPAEQLRRLVDPHRTEPLPVPDRIGYLGSTVLSLSPAGHRLRRTAADTIELHTPEGTLLDGAWSQGLRSPALPLPRGQVIELPYMSATVLEDHDGRPTRVSFRFDRPLDDPSLVFVILAQRRLVRLTLPPVGGEIALPRERPLF
jgi:hypothetical protein